ncbi:MULTISPECIES: hypothetical protein [Frankia]|uniref:hypothetical protein n=1 Tax=Frankia TaxID=1854 RepID=UPI0002E0031D|nr:MULTISPECIES: hypothetical protein [Frankia]
MVTRALAGLEPWDDARPRRMICIHGADPARRLQVSERVVREFHARGSGRTPAAGDDAHRPARTRVARVDVASLGDDPERFLVALRTAVEVGPVIPGDFPAFDLGLLIYWARWHPEVTLAHHVIRRAVCGPTIARLRVAQALDDRARSVSGDGEPSWLDLLRAPEVATLREQCPALDHVVTGRPEQIRPLLPGLLGWDLQRRTELKVVVVLDSVDAARGLSARPGDLEEVIVGTADLPTLVVVSLQSPEWASRRAGALHPHVDLIDAAAEAGAGA